MDLLFDDLDSYLLSQKGRIIHQVWFGTIPNKREARIAYDKLKYCRDSWKVKNPTWCHVEWNNSHSESLLKKHFPEYLELYRYYPYEIQRVDCIRYFILFRYGGLYADMDYYCNKSFDEALTVYDKDIYFVQSPNQYLTNYKEHISNSLMYSKPNHPYWKKLFLQLELHKSPPVYYTKHMVIMYTTGPAFLNKIYSRYKYSYKLSSLPFKFFHPYGIEDDIFSLKGENIYAIHIGKGSWEKADGKIMILIIRNLKIILFIILCLSIPLITAGLQTYLSHNDKQT